MARRPRRTSFRSRSTSRRTSFSRGTSRRPYGRRTSRRRTGSSAGRTIKLVIQTTNSPVADVPLPLGMKPGPRPKVARF